jgi:broad specificity phosphatase PhoE
MTETFTRIYLLRHGEVINPEGVYYGQDDMPLSDTGRAQSLDAARNLAGAGISAVFSSDLSRCRFLARAISGLCGAAPVYSAALREVNFGKWTGLTWARIEHMYPGAFEQRMNDLEGFRPPGGENLADLRTRVVKKIQQAVDENPGSSIAVVAHGGVNRVFLAACLGMPLSNIFSLDQGHACTNIVDIFEDGIAVIRAVNLPWHMDKSGFIPSAVV